MSDKKRILVRSTNWIGDAILTTPSIAALKQLYPDSRLTVAAKSWVTPVFEQNPDVDQILPIRGDSLFESVSAYRKEQFDLAVILPNSFRSALEGFLAGIPERLGYRRSGRGMLLTRPVTPTLAQLKIHQVYYYLDLIKQLGEFDLAPALRLVVTEEERQDARKKFHLPPEPLIAVNPGATYGSAKRWLPERFAAAADALTERFACRAIVVGSAKERKSAEEIMTASCSDRLLNLCGQTTLRELMALISQCRFMVTNDSGPMHIAAGLKVPLAAIFGSTDPRTTAPFGSPHIIIRREEVECSPCLRRECPIDHRCMERISVEDVLAASLKLIEQEGVFA